MAEQMGKAAAGVVDAARAVPGHWEETRARLLEMPNRVKQSAWMAGIQGENLVRHTAASAWLRTEQLAGERPLQVIAGAAGAGFVLGFALRLRRYNRARSRK
jgi:ElaB/YqjD/DUF883 family membrane-anchored ribosome-binding protein